MNSQEFNSRSRKHRLTEDELEKLIPMYLALHVDKDDFCRIVDLFELEELIAQNPYYKRICVAVDEFIDRENYSKIQSRLYELTAECERFLTYVNACGGGKK